MTSVSRPAAILACFAVALAAVPGRLQAQSVGATFGNIVVLNGTPSDIVLDEARGRLYLINDKANRVDVLPVDGNRPIASLSVGLQPLAGAITPDNAYLYVTNYLGSSLSVIDLGSLTVVQTIPLPTRPQGIEVGGDGSVLVACDGVQSSGVWLNTLLVVDRTQPLSQQVVSVPYPPPPSTPPTIPPANASRPTTTFKSKLVRTPDGNFIVGIVLPNTTTTLAFVYEVASRSVIRTRQVNGQSSVLAISPDGARFMAGVTQYDVATLNVTAQYSANNAPFALGSGFNLQQNFGGSAFSPDGSTLYSAFNVAPVTTPATRPQASTLLISDPRHLAIRLGIKLPESLVGRMVITSDGSNAWGLSESGVIHVPLSELYDHPILMPETTQVFLAQDECNRGLVSAPVRINNLGKGKLTFSLPTTANTLVVMELTSGVAPATVRFTMEPGRFGYIRQPGTNLVTTTAGGTVASGGLISITLSSVDAINIPNLIQVYMNYRQPDQRGQIFPVSIIPNVNEGLQDIVLDEARGRAYLTNSGYNRLEVFDTVQRRFLDPVPVGQLPHQMAMTLDGNTLYVGNTGAESISVVDLGPLDGSAMPQVIGQVEFPPIPWQANFGIPTPRTLAMGYYGLQFIMNNGGQWKVVGNQAIPRPRDTVTAASATGATTISSPATMLATPGSEYIVTLSNAGNVYLYDSAADTYTTGQLLFSAPIQGYYGPLGAALKGNFYLANGLIMNSSLRPIGGGEKPNFPTTAPTLFRNVAAVAPIDEKRFLRLTLPVRANLGTTPRDDPRPTLETVDIDTGTETFVGVAPENPILTVLGSPPTRTALPARQMVVSSTGTIYAITLSGLSVMPLEVPADSKPAIAAGARAIVNSSDGTASFRPGSFVTVNGSSLASEAKADTLPAPTILGGSCLTFGDIPVPLLDTSGSRISAQLPDNLMPGIYLVQVRSLANGQQSDPVMVTVQRPTPPRAPAPGDSGDPAPEEQP